MPKPKKIKTRYCIRCHKYFKSTAKFAHICDGCNIMVQRTNEARARKAKAEKKQHKLEANEEKRQADILNNIFSSS